ISIWDSERHTPCDDLFSYVQLVLLIPDAPEGDSNWFEPRLYSWQFGVHLMVHFLKEICIPLPLNRVSLGFLALLLSSLSIYNIHILYYLINSFSPLSIFYKQFVDIIKFVSFNMFNAKR